jgi:hypothetical protein
MFPLIPLLRIEATKQTRVLPRSPKWTRVSINSTSKNRSNIGGVAEGFAGEVFPLIPLLRIEATEVLSGQTGWPDSIVSINSTSKNRSNWEL